MSNTHQETALDIRVYGLVQGVGFRPFLYGLAQDLRLTGWTLNRNDCVQIRVQGAARNIEQFLYGLRELAPPLSRIEQIQTEGVAPDALTEFQILRSESRSADVTQVSPDVAICADCLEDMRRQPNRIAYPFTNCTNCGPRFSIIQDLPYDRACTTMNAFTMCPQCQREYEDIRDRRFHAQPNACRDCGPQYELTCNGQPVQGIDAILRSTADLLDNGQIVAIKGIGGFHLACDALNEEAVAELRRRKMREGKPFAVMCRDLDCARRYAAINDQERDLLRSPRRPILLLKKIHDLAPSVTRGLNTLGVMLPYTPLHYLLFERLHTDVIVLTSGNLSDEPILISNTAAQKQLTGIADAILTYNRAIHNRSDDSVARVVNGKPRLLRRSRGWVPEPIRLPFEVEGILATGAELKNCFCVGKGQQAILSQHIGDLKNLDTYEFYQEAVARFQRLFRVQPHLIVCDRHPDYLSTRFAQECGLPTLAVQHHHAHIASCLAEHGLNEPVIGISFDGTGLGDDLAIWGGEFLVCDLRDYTRVTHLDYVPMPGGDKAAQEPWRMGLAYLHKIFGADFLELDLPFLAKLPAASVKLLCSALDKDLNCPQTSSMGRLFDAVAALMNLVTHADFEAEAPIRLETIITPTDARYSYQLADVIRVDAMIREIVADLRQSTPPGIIAAKFHNTIAAIIVDVATRIRAERGLHRMALSGGVFQNAYLLERAETQLQTRDFEVYSNLRVPANDGGLCLGQLAIAAHNRER